MYNYNFPISRNGAPFIRAETIEEIAQNILKNAYGDEFYKKTKIDIDELAEFELEFDLEYAYLSHNQTYYGMMVFDNETIIPTLKDLYPTKRGEPELIYLENRANTILIDKTLSANNLENLRRFTLGHECGHGLLHRDFFYKDYNQISLFEDKAGVVACRKKDIHLETPKIWTSTDTVEWQANTFSSCIFMNKKSIDYYIEQLGYRKYLGNHFYMSDLVNKISENFGVSKQAGFVRLKILGYLDTYFNFEDQIIIDDFYI